MLIQPFDGIRESGLLELIGINEQVDQNDYSGSVELDVSPGPQPCSGVIQQVAFIQTEDGSGAILSLEGDLYVFDADPNPTSGDTALTAAEWVTCIGKCSVASTDWNTDANGGFAKVIDEPIWFHGAASLYFVFKLTSATSVNSAAGDDEQLEINVWYQLYG